LPSLSSVICLSVTFEHPTQPVEIFGNVSTPFCSQASHLLSTMQNFKKSSQGNPSDGGKTQEGQPNIATLDMSKAISRKRCKIRPRVQLMTNRKSYLWNSMVSLWILMGDTYYGLWAPIWGNRAETVFLGVAGKNGATTPILPNFRNLSKMSRSS